MIAGAACESAQLRIIACGLFVADPERGAALHGVDADPL
jgi:hypothetical protein